MYIYICKIHLHSCKKTICNYTYVHIQYIYIHMIYIYIYTYYIYIYIYIIQYTYHRYHTQCIWDPEVSAHDISGQCNLELQEGLKPVVLERQKAVGGLWTAEGKVSWPIRNPPCPPWPLFASNHAVGYRLFECFEMCVCVCTMIYMQCLYYISVSKYIYIYRNTTEYKYYMYCTTHLNSSLDQPI